uniref:Uncharacterized protein n=1 Tax=Sphaerodactylus townsendi TaxID=933632 RepID=A0ACB8E9T0_9SAUR
MFQRHQPSRVTVARGSALEMEIRRGRCRLSLLAQPEQRWCNRQNHESSCVGIVPAIHWPLEAQDGGGGILPYQSEVEPPENLWRPRVALVLWAEESSFWLPLYGSVCCRLAAQPRCMVHQMMGSFLRVQPGEQPGWLRLFCVLRGPKLLCYHHPQDAETPVEPAFTITISKETRIRVMERDPKNHSQSMLITNHYGAEEVTHTLQAENRAETQRWMEAFWQHFYDMSEWKRRHEA